MNNFQQRLLSLSECMKKASERVCNSESVSQLDIDVLRQRMKELYDFLLTADYEEAPTEPLKEEPIELPEIITIQEPQVIIPEPKIVIPELELEPEVKEEKVEEKKEEVIEEKQEEVKEEIIAIKVEEPIEIKPIEITIEEVVEEEPKEEVKEEIEEEIKVEIKEEPKEIKEESKKTSVLDYLHNNIMKDNEQKSAKKEEYTTLDLFKSQPSIADSFENKTRSDLRTAIGVGEKFMFINDLFSGDLKAYTNFINLLNEANSAEMSMVIIEENRNKRKWIKNSLAYSTLENLVKKRFKK